MVAVPDVDQAIIIMQHRARIQHTGVTGDRPVAQGSSSFSQACRCAGKLDLGTAPLRIPHVFAMRKNKTQKSKNFEGGRWRTWAGALMKRMASQWATLTN
jgi:hypothetical protein